MEDKIKEKKTFSSDMKNLYPMLIWVKERVIKYFNQKDLENIELSCEEIFINIIKHGYLYKKGSIHIDLTLNAVLEITFTDKAKKFNPFDQKEKIYKKLSKKEREVGGLGIFLVFECMDEVIYKRESSCNILTIIKKRSLNYWFFSIAVKVASVSNISNR